MTLVHPTAKLLFSFYSKRHWKFRFRPCRNYGIWLLQELETEICYVIYYIVPASFSLHNNRLVRLLIPNFFIIPNYGHERKQNSL